MNDRAGLLRRVLLAAVLAPLVPTGLRAQDAGDQARALAARERYQVELPGAAPPRDGGATDGFRAAPPGQRGVGIGVETPSTGSLKVLAWLLPACAVVLVLLVSIRRSKGSQLRDAAPGNGAAARDPAPTPRDDGLARAEVLARDGHLAAALRVLLAAAIEAVGNLGGAQVPRSMTARELARHGALRSEARGAFATLVDAVERSLFAGRAACAEDFARSVAAYLALWRAAGQDET